LLIGAALYFLQTAFLFHPKKLPAGYVFHFDEKFEEMKIPFENADTISLIKFFTADTLKRGVVVYYHGNMENVERYAKFAANFTKHGYEVWMMDYPGFGKSTGIRSEEKLYSQALLIRNKAAEKFNPSAIIIYGKSLGTGIAAYVASQTENKKLILETPYSSIPDLFSCYAPIYPTNVMSIYKISTYEYLKKVKCPVNIFHGTDDGVIPYRCAAKLKMVLKATDEFITIKNGTHNNLNDFEEYHQKLDSLLKF
jgi:alpha-beta hydrolase superfamily lysophospholipase